MRIGLLVDQYHRPTGVGVYTRALLRELVKASNGHEYVAIFPGAEQCARIADDMGGIQTCSLPRRAGLYPLWHATAWPPIELFTGRLDLLHVFSGSVTTPCRCPLLVTVHDLASERRPHDYPWRRRWFKHRMLTTLKQQRAHVLAISEFTAADVVELAYAPPERVHVTYNGLDRSLFARADADEQTRARRRYKLPDRFLLFVGAISPRKNIGVLLRAFDELVRTGTDIDLVLAGPLDDGWGADDVEGCGLSASTRSRLHRTGYIEEHDLPAVYSAAEIFVYPSKYEGFGMPMLEAMACGTPVIAARATCLPEVAGEAALYFEPDSPADLAHQISRLLASSQAREHAVAKGYRQVQRYDWERIGRQVVSIHERVVRGML